MAIGEFLAQEIILYCPACNGKYPSSQFRNLAPKRSRFGYDVIEYIGRAMFLEHRSNLDIVESLKNRNIEISVREIAFLGKKFIIYLALAHREAGSKIRQSMNKRGGYILHLDGTCDGGSPHLVSCLDGLSKLVLDNIKIPSERSEYLIPFLKEVKQTYGKPLAMVHDMGSGIQKAVDEVFPGVPDYICHFHFLRDIGKDLLEPDYATIRTCLKNNRVRSLLRQKARSLEKNIELNSLVVDEFEVNLESGKILSSSVRKKPALVAFALIHWILDAECESGGYGFPFDRPHFIFAQRLKIVQKILLKIKDKHLTNEGLVVNIKANAPLARPYEYLTSVLHNKHLNHAKRNMETKIRVFDSLRYAMRIALPEGKFGLNDDGENADICTIEKKLTEFRDWINSDSFPHNRDQFSKFIAQLEKYWPKLFAAAIEVETETGKIKIQPQRTNNDMERLFRDINHGHRKKTGTSKMNRAFQAILADTPLIRNLRNEEYVTIILGGHSTLAERFSGINALLVRKEMDEVAKKEGRIPTNFTRLLRRKTLTGDIVKIFFEDPITI